MRGALVIFLAMIVVGIILYIYELRYRRGDKKEKVASSSSVSAETLDAVEGSGVNQGNGKEEAEDGEETEECCGMHLTCEKDTLSPVSGEVEYYDDEELDRFIGRTPDSYSMEEVEEFRDVLMTLQGDDVPGWARSIATREIQLPEEIRDELLMLVNEQRLLKTKKV